MANDATPETIAATMFALIHRSARVGEELASGIANIAGHRRRQTGSNWREGRSNSTPPSSASHHVLPAIRRERRAGDQAGIVGSEKYHAARDLLGLAEPPERDQRQDVLLQDLLGHRLDHFGGDVAWADRVDGDARARAFLRQRLGEAELARLGGGIVGLAHLALLPV